MPRSGIADADRGRDRLGLGDRMAGDKRGGAGGLEAEHHRPRLDEARVAVRVEGLPVRSDVAGVADRECYGVRCPAEVVDDLERGGLLAGDAMWIDAVDEDRPRGSTVLRQAAHEPQRVVEAALDRDDTSPAEERLHELSAGDAPGREDDDRLEAGRCRIGRGRRRRVPRGGADHGPGTLLERAGDGHDHAPILERSGRVETLDLELELGDADRAAEGTGVHERRIPLPEGDRRGRGGDRQEGRVALQQPGPSATRCLLLAKVAQHLGHAHLRADCTGYTSSTMPAERVFSGIQPSGVTHLGNYLGAIRNYIALQDRYEAIYCIVDYHALTSTHDPEAIRRNTTQMAVDLLALGLDPERATLFVQSDRPEHTELAWLLSTVTPVAWVERTPTFKEKRRDQPEDVNHALLTYPVLQTADIAIYKARHVPVGKDQEAHLELAREIVRAFNRRYGGVFVEPQAVYTESPVIVGTDGVNKMSKSIGNTIDVLAEPDVVRRQVMSMVTDTDRIYRSQPGHPERCNVCQTHRFFGEDFEAIWEGERTARTGCVDTKRLLADRIIESFAPARERRRELLERSGYVEEVLAAGAARLAPRAAETMADVRDRMGLRPRPRDAVAVG